MSVLFDSLVPYSEGWWRTTLSSIGDAVIVTDAKGDVAFLNPVAESLTGWTDEEAKNRPLEEIFEIIHEMDRTAVENPVHKVLQTGTVVELANHTILKSRNGSEVPIDDSAAPIKDLQGNIFGIVLVFRDVSERRRAEAARLRLSAIVDSSDDAIVGKTLESVITSWNPAAERIFGYTAAEAVGQKIYLIIPPERHPEEDQILAKLKLGERIEHFETVRRRKDGTMLDISVTISPIKDSEGHIIGASKIARDISERKQIEKERDELLRREQAARAEAEQANRLKDEFLATVSHELRTPLNSMFGWIRLLRKGGLDEDSAQRALEVIDRSAKAQEQIIADILDTSRIITGKLRIDLQPVGLPQVIEAAVDSVRPTAEARDIRLQVLLDPSASPVLGDANRLQQIVWNLLTNSVKFTPKGGRVRVQLERVDSHVELAVTDTGQGISPDFLPQVFDRFRQAEGGTTRQHGGLGLGLAIVRHLVELHGGTVRAESEGVGKGAIFTVSLPLAVMREVPNPLTSQTGPLRLTPGKAEWKLTSPPDLTGLRVLIVDDEADARELLVAILEQCGGEARAAASAAEGVALVSDWRPHVIVSDIGMPTEDGYMFIRRVRALPPDQGGNTPAAALTAYTKMEDRLRALSAGYQTHVGKPVDPTELMAIVGSLTGRLGRG